MLESLVKWYDFGTKKILSNLSHPFLLVFRLYFGYQFFLTGKGKLGNIEGVTRFFDGLGIPAPGFQKPIPYLSQTELRKLNTSLFLLIAS